jgi:regulator of protease activity HflC (stomatin/prohibitin superfamily)
MTGQQAADIALAEAREEREKVEQAEKKMKPVLDRIQRAVDENAIFAKFVETLR